MENNKKHVLTSKIERLIEQYPDSESTLKKIIELEIEEKIPEIIKLKSEISDKFFSILSSTLNYDGILKILEFISNNRMLSSHSQIKTLLNYLLDDFDNQSNEHKEMNKDYYKKMLSYIVIILYYQKDSQDIDQCYNRFIRLNKNEMNKESMIIYHYEGLVLYQKRYYYDAIRFYNDALNCAEDIGAEDYKSRIYDCLGRAFGDKGLFKEAFQYYELSIKIKEEIGDEQGLAMTLGNKGRLHITVGEYDKALASFKKDLIISEKTNDVIGQIIMTSQIGEMFWIKKNIKSALKFCKKSYSLAIAFSQQHPNITGIGFALIGMANCYLDLKDNKKFLEYLNELKKTFSNKKDYEYIIGLYNKILGKYFERMKDFDKAEKHYKKCIKLTSERMLLVDKGLINERLAVLYSKKGDETEYKKYLISAIKLFEKANAFYHLRRVQNRLRDFDIKEWLIYAFRGFLGKSVIEHIIKGETIAGHIGEKKFVSVLFSDIRNFTSFSETIKAEDLVETLNDYLSKMSNIIEKFYGDIDKYIGDAIMAVYYPVTSKEESALNSVYSAWYMVRELYLFNRVLIDKKKQPIKIGIGIHSGEVISGTMGSSSRKNYTVIGDVVNTSSRIEELTKVYGVSILLSEETYKLCAKNKDFIFREIDKVRVKGKSKPTTIYELIDINKAFPKMTF